MSLKIVIFYILEIIHFYGYYPLNIYKIMEILLKMEVQGRFWKFES